jgi:hypothetical protein
MLTALICLSCFYLGAFVVLHVRAVAKAGLTSRHSFETTTFRTSSPPFTRVIPWNGHLYTEAPTDAEVAELFLRKDLELAGRGQ